MEGMQEAGVMACGKHFPGHGDTTTDSHIDLPVISENKQRFEAFEFVPFKALIQADVATLMIGHLAAPQLSLNEHVPATFSEKIVKNILRDELHFEGVIITDSLSMQALARTYPFQEIAKRAHLAGCHLLLYADHIDAKVDELLQKTIPEAIGALKKAYEDGDFPIEILDACVVKILKLKTKLRKIPLSSKTAYETIHSEEAKALKKTLYQNALTLLVNPDALLPLTLDAEKKIALLSFQEKSNFLKALKKYANIESIEVTSCSPNIQQLKPYDVVIVPLYTSQPGKSGFEIPSEQRALLDKLQANAIKTIVVLFTTPYALSSLNPHFATIVAYEDDPDAEEAAAGLIFGLYEPKGKLPVTGAPWCPLGSGLSWNETVD
jgi:beta-glucosidase-like glycosyl hydrolase